jgi:hypothetical protein
VGRLKDSADKVITALDTVDVANLLGRFLNGLKSSRDRSPPTTFAAQLAAWVAPFGDDLLEFADRVRKHGRHRAFSAAARDFAAANAYRAPALQAFDAVAMRSSLRGTARWRWAASSYAAAVREFVSERDRVQTAESLSSSLLPALSAARVDRYWLLKHLAAHCTDRLMDRDHRPVLRRIHHGRRLEQIITEAEERNVEYAQLRETRDALRYLVASRQALPQAERLIASYPQTLRGQLHAYQRVLDELETAERRERVKQATREAEARLQGIWNRAVTRDPEFWRRTVNRLSQPALE